MTDTPKKPNRKRRRRRGRRRNPETERSSDKAQQSQNQPSAKSASSTSKKDRRKGERRRSRRTSVRAKGHRGEQGSKLVVHRQHGKNMDISPLNPDIFIYTHTLRPRSLLDDYQTGPGVAERMLYENGGADE
ncbi:MAG: hypothetical protein GY759_03805 [Chloroflexi bacterium]|nr:hypothetical protein [Chloroflexota bacterium]